MGMLPTLGASWAGHRAVAMERGATAAEISNTYTDIIKAVRQGIQVLIIAIGAYLILKAKIHQGMLFANMILASRALQPIEKIVGSWDPLNNMVRAYDRLNSLLAKAEAPFAATSLPRPLGKLSVEGVGFAPPAMQKLLLANVNFALEPNEVLGVIGPSGAGKSTLARLLVGIWRPVQGVCRLDGADVFTWDRSDFGRYVGYLPQDTELFAGTVRDNIARFRADVTDIRRSPGANLRVLALERFDQIGHPGLANLEQGRVREPGGAETDKVIEACVHFDQRRHRGRGRRPAPRFPDSKRDSALTTITSDCR